jgi:hypothetical protein
MIPRDRLIAVMLRLHRLDGIHPIFDVPAPARTTQVLICHVAQLTRLWLIDLRCSQGCVSGEIVEVSCRYAEAMPLLAVLHLRFLVHLVPSAPGESLRSCHPP